MLHIAGKAGEEFFNCPEDVWASLRDLGEIDTLLHRMGMREEREARIVEGKARARIILDEHREQARRIGVAAEVAMGGRSARNGPGHV